MDEFKPTPGKSSQEYRYIVYELDLTIPRNKVQFATGLMNTLLVREIQDINANLHLQFQTRKSHEFPLRAQDTFNFRGLKESSMNDFDKVYFTNDAVAAGSAILIFAYNIEIHTLTRLTADMIQEGIRSSVVTVGVLATPIPAVALPGRINMLINNTSANITYYGAADVAVATGMPVDAGDKLSLNIAEGVTLYGIAAIASDIRIMEGS